MKDKKAIMKKACCDGKGGCKGKGGLMQDTIKEIPNTISRGIKSVRNFGGKVLDSYVQGFKNVDDANRERNKNVIKENWGSVENYEKLQKKVKGPKKSVLKSVLKRVAA